MRETEKKIYEFSASHSYQRGGILYHDPGIGKTLILLSYVYWVATSTIQRKPTLLVITKSLMNVWRREIDRHFGSCFRILFFHPEFVNVQNISATDLKKNYQLIITTYDILSTANNRLKELDGLKKEDEEWDYLFCKEIEECIHRDPCRPRVIKNVSPRDVSASSSSNDLRPSSGVSVLYSESIFSRIILDESHLVANFDTKRWKLVWGIATHFVWLSTGTLVVNSDSDVWSQLKLLGIPMKEKEWEATKTMDTQDYWSWISRRTRVALKDQIILGELEFSEVPLELSPQEQKMYRIILKMCFAVVETYQQEKEAHSSMTYKFHDILEFFTATRKCCSFPFMLLGSKTKMEKRLREMAEAEIEDMSAEEIRWLSEYHLESSGWKSSKTVWILRYCKVQISQNDDKIIIWSMFTTGLIMLKDLLSSELPNVRIECLCGKLSSKERLRLEKDFFSDPTFRILLMHFRVGGLGMNLQIANRNIFIDPWWNWSRDIQALDRTHRPGQTKKVYCHALFIKCSIEPYLMQQTLKKKDLATNYESFCGGSGRGLLVTKNSPISARSSSFDFETLKEIIFKSFLFYNSPN